MVNMNASFDKASPNGSGSRHAWVRRWVAPVTLMLVVGASTLGLGGCNQLAKVGVGTTPINKVVSNPTKYPNVVVRGQVVNHLGILGRGAYEIKDKTGSLWIFTQSGMPPVNSTVTVRGAASEGIAFGGNTLGVTITEKERL